MTRRRYRRPHRAARRDETEESVTMQIILLLSTYVRICIAVEQREASFAWTLVDGAAIAAGRGEHLGLVLAQQRVKGNTEYIRTVILLNMSA